MDEKDGGTMKKLLNNILFFSVMAALLFSVYLSIDVDIKQKKLIDDLKRQVSQLNTELTDLKTQQEAINFISQDLSAGLAEVKGWK